VELTLHLFQETGELYRSPTVVTTALKQMGLTQYGLQEINGVTLFPTDYFYPFSWLDKYSPDCIGENTFCIHHWLASWQKRE
jgi:hypothetical protein